MCLAPRRALRSLVVRPTALGNVSVWEEDTWWDRATTEWVDIARYDHVVEDALLDEFRSVSWLQAAQALTPDDDITAHVDHNWVQLNRLETISGFYSSNVLTRFNDYFSRNGLSDKKVGRYFFG